MNDDWRLRMELHEVGLAHELTDRLEAVDLAHDLSTAFHDRVVVSRDGAEVFCYAASREQAEATKNWIRSLAADHGWHLKAELEHWHPVSESWEDPDKSLPAADAERAAERRELMEKERKESEARGYPQYEVRVRCPSRRDALELVEKLRDDDVPSVQRWHFVVLGARDEDGAKVLAERVRREAPAGSTVIAEGSVSTTADEAPFATAVASPFSVFGGLGG